MPSSLLFSASHSGASLILKDDLVIKIVDNSERSIKAIEAQQNFQEIRNRDFTLRSVPIYNIMHIDDTLHISMPYIHGFSGQSIALSGKTDLAIQIRDILSMYMAMNLSKSVRTEITKNVLIDKLNTIEYTTMADIFLSQSLKFVDVINSFSPPFYVPIGECHGDLTFSNLLYNGSGVLYIYDFLSSFISSPILDYAKIRQDCYHGWTLRKLRGGSLASGLQFIRSAYPAELLAMIENSYNAECKLFSILNLLRIAPYVRDDQTASWLCGRINLELQKFL